MREEYGRPPLSESNCDSNPIVQFERWFREVQATKCSEPNAMTLATASAQARPSARVVLLKEVSETGFVFYTNYTSRKAEDLETNPFAALTFHWPELARQVRVEGRVQRTPREETEKYFRSRPKGSRLGAWASHQSQIVPDREPLDARLRQLQEQYAKTDDVPVPEFWGGYCVVPDSIEFWEGRPNRMHDRLRYRRKSETAWIRERLSP
ncbi:MAG: pyridoxamine 5'-phosphate oxidase [Acidobacteriaceae bacterium]|nr:pyridoxamine 5'-phosphate oxidase [Acidobacteriaceae bacterium]